MLYFHPRSAMTTTPAAATAVATAVAALRLRFDALHRVELASNASVVLSTELRTALRAIQPDLAALPRPACVPAEDVPGRLVACVLTELERLDMADDALMYTFQLKFASGFFAKIERYVKLQNAE
jgi:hypothetical protein